LTRRVAGLPSRTPLPRHCPAPRSMHTRAPVPRASPAP
jgi:hypothetical protein